MTQQSQSLPKQQLDYFGHAWADDMGGARPVPTPIDEVCGWCGELIGPGENGVIMPHVHNLAVGRHTHSIGCDMRSLKTPLHLECYVRQREGSVLHQRGECSCSKPGPRVMADPSDLLSLRQEAQAAVAVWLDLHPHQHLPI